MADKIIVLSPGDPAIIRQVKDVASDLVIVEANQFKPEPMVIHAPMVEIPELKLYQNRRARRKAKRKR